MKYYQQIIVCVIRVLNRYEFDFSEFISSGSVFYCRGSSQFIQLNHYILKLFNYQK